MKTLQELIKDIETVEVYGELTVPITGISYDSRKVEPGSLFVCVEGFKVDGHDFVDSALQKGAAAVIAEKRVEVPAGVPLVLVRGSRRVLALVSSAFCGHPSQKLTMVGITGTNGKTTTAFLMEQVFREQGYKVGLIGTVMNKIGDMILPVTNTTPESLDLQLLLRDMVENGVTHTVMEVSSHALELDRVAGVQYDAAVFTNITQDHLDFHENMANYLAAKQKLFAGLGEHKSKKQPKFGIINADDPKSGDFIGATKGQVITYGVENKSDFQARHINLRAEGVKFYVAGPDGDIDLNLQLTGMFNVYNSLAAVAACSALGVELAVIKKALEAVRGVPGRFERVDAGQDFSVVVDYAHTPDGLENIIRAARAITKGRVITVFGCGGDRDRTKRPIMGEISARLSDYTVLTSDNPRTEEPLAILSQIEEGVRRVVDRTRYSMLPDRREAIAQAIGMAKAGDVVIIAGKGHETYQLIKDETLHFDDREEALKALQAAKRVSE